MALHITNKGLDSPGIRGETGICPAPDTVHDVEPGDDTVLPKLMEVFKLIVCEHAAYGWPGKPFMGRSVRAVLQAGTEERYRRRGEAHEAPLQHVSCCLDHCQAFMTSTSEGETRRLDARTTVPSLSLTTSPNGKRLSLFSEHDL